MLLLLLLLLLLRSLPAPPPPPPRANSSPNYSRANQSEDAAAPVRGNHSTEITNLTSQWDGGAAAATVPVIRRTSAADRLTVAWDGAACRFFLWQRLPANKN